jgi:sugar phosphate isomerase/epimerase
MRFAICSEIFEGWPLAETMGFVAKTGYAAVEIAPFTLAPLVSGVSRSQRQLIRDQAARAGIAISGIHWVLAKTEGFHVTHPEASVRAHTLRYLHELVDFCGDLGGQTMVFGSPKQRSLLAGVSRPQAVDYARQALMDLAPHLADRGVTFCLEPLAPSETNFINTAAEAVALVREVNSPQVRIILDVKAMSSEATPIPELIRQSRGYFAYFHANDANLKGPGFGEVDFAPILAALREAGYDGYVSVEVFRFDEGPEVIARASLAYLHKVMAGLPGPAAA